MQRRKKEASDAMKRRRCKQNPLEVQYIISISPTGAFALHLLYSTGVPPGHSHTRRIGSEHRETGRQGSRGFPCVVSSGWIGFRVSALRVVPRGSEGPLRGTVAWRSTRSLPAPSIRGSGPSITHSLYDRDLLDLTRSLTWIREPND